MRQQPAVALGAVRVSLILGLLASPQAVVRAGAGRQLEHGGLLRICQLVRAPLAPGACAGYLDGGQASQRMSSHPGPTAGQRGSLGAIVLIRRYDCTFDQGAARAAGRL